MEVRQGGGPFGMVPSSGCSMGIALYLLPTGPAVCGLGHRLRGRLIADVATDAELVGCVVRGAVQGVEAESDDVAGAHIGRELSAAERIADLLRILAEPALEAVAIHVACRSLSRAGEAFREVASLAALATRIGTVTVLLPEPRKCMTRWRRYWGTVNG